MQKKRRTNPKVNFNRMNDPLKLNQASLLGSGRWRRTFAHPTNSEFVVKVLHPEKIPAKQKNYFSIKRSPLFRHPIIFDQNRYDLHFINLFHKQHGEKLWQHFPKTPGIVNTTIGEGLLQKRILNHDGSPSCTLRSYLEKNKTDHTLEQAVFKFLEYVEKHRIPIRDITFGNLMIQNNGKDHLNLVMVDGFGDTDFLKLSRYLPSLAKHKHQKVAARLTHIFN